MTKLQLPETIPNWIGGRASAAADGSVFDKISPHDSSLIAHVARTRADGVLEAVATARRAQPKWADTPAVRRGAILHAVCNLMEMRRQEIAAVVVAETGKSLKDALGETDGAIALGRFYAGEGQRLYGRTTTSGAANKYGMTVRQPCGVAGLIVAANTPIANVAWKVFPALICGNGVVLKAAEDTPGTAWIFGRIAQEAGLPDGILNIIQGLGQEAGAALVDQADLDVISFTGSTGVGRWIGDVAGRRLIKTSLELGGKNPLVVCDDADLDNAVKWTLLSAFSNAGQRCAAASRIIVFDAVYDQFVAMLVEATGRLKVGPSDEDDFGPVINARQLAGMLAAVESAAAEGAHLLAGGHRLDAPALARGFYMAPTLIGGVSPEAEISRCELFGPVACLYRVPGFREALDLANASPYGLTACIHSRSFDRVMEFCYKVQAGVAVANAGTFGSEPHMPFGGVKQSGNGSREPGTEALDIYSDLKDIYLNVDPGRLD